MTIALGVLRGTGVVLAADTEETIGDVKAEALKVNTGIAFGFQSGKPSAMAITGAGYGPYLDAIFQQFTDFFREQEALPIDDIGSEFQAILLKFYADHVIPFRDADLIDFELIVGAQRDGQSRLWVSSRSVLRRSNGHEAVGMGSAVAKQVLLRAGMPNLELEMIAAIACYAVLRAKETVVGCGKNTLLIYLSNNGVQHVYPAAIRKAEELFRRYEGLEFSSFMFSVDHRFPDESKHLRKMQKWQKELRAEFGKLVAQMRKDREIHT
jgi:20S proteasome alpha/beta subunit